MGVHLVNLEVASAIVALMGMILGAKKLRKAVVISLRSLRNDPSKK